MKDTAIRAIDELNEVYLRAFNESPRVTVESEAFSLGVASTTCRAYLSIDDERKLPAGLVPLSHFAHPLMEHLAEKTGGVFVPLSGHLNGTSNDELAAILKIASQIVREPDSAKKAKLFKQIETKAARAAKEEGK